MFNKMIIVQVIRDSHLCLEDLDGDTFLCELPLLDRSDLCSDLQEQCNRHILGIIVPRRSRIIYVQSTIHDMALPRIFTMIVKVFLTCACPKIYDLCG